MAVNLEVSVHLKFPVFNTRSICQERVWKESDISLLYRTGSDVGGMNATGGFLSRWGVDLKNLLTLGI